MSGLQLTPEQRKKLLDDQFFAALLAAAVDEQTRALLEQERHRQQVQRAEEEMARDAAYQASFAHGRVASSEPAPTSLRVTPGTSLNQMQRDYQAFLEAADHWTRTVWAPSVDAAAHAVADSLADPLAASPSATAHPAVAALATTVASAPAATRAAVTAAWTAAKGTIATRLAAAPSPTTLVHDNPTIAADLHHHFTRASGDDHTRMTHAARLVLVPHYTNHASNVLTEEAGNFYGRAATVVGQPINQETQQQMGRQYAQQNQASLHPYITAINQNLQCINLIEILQNACKLIDQQLQGQQQARRHSATPNPFSFFPPAPVSSADVLDLRNEHVRRAGRTGGRGG